MIFSLVCCLVTVIHYNIRNHKKVISPNPWKGPKTYLEGNSNFNILKVKQYNVYDSSNKRPLES